MMVTTVSRASASNADERLVGNAMKAGAQFEGILLNMVFGDLERAFTQLPGSTQDAVSTSYNSFGVEALTSALAQGGGIGLGPFIARALIAHSKHDGQVLKVF